MKPTSEELDRLVNRFLAYSFPEDFHPDGGITFEKFGNVGTKHQYTRRPMGTNLLDARQAREMFEHLFAEEEIVKKFKVPRAVVYAVIDGERDYQEAGKGNAQRHPDADKAMTPGEFILCMEKCLSDARDAWYKPQGGQASLEFVRKVAGLAVQCMELHGAPRRQ
jgi:hypothetical protein